MEKHLHIVCLDVPYPVDYGGVFDIFYKVKTLYELGIRIHLHCFEYGRGQQTELNKYCTEVQYYARNEGHKGFSTDIPYIVASRASIHLLANLQKDDHPILLEGVHCTYLLHGNALRNRKIFLRLHNVEYKYYYNLFRCESSLFKKAYYYNESRLLKCYEKSIANKAFIIAPSQKDAATYQQVFGAEDVCYLPVFLPFQRVCSLEGTGTYCLYHGNLSVTENEKAALWLLENVFSKIKLPFVIAGKNPSPRLERMVHIHPHACLVSNPGDAEMDDLIAKAQVNILPSFNETGIKLKLLHALFNGRHCVVNDATVNETGLEAACHIGSTTEALGRIITQLYYLPFGEEEIRLRQKLLCKQFNNRVNGITLTGLIW